MAGDGVEVDAIRARNRPNAGRYATFESESPKGPGVCPTWISSGGLDGNSHSANDQAPGRPRIATIARGGSTRIGHGVENRTGCRRATTYWCARKHWGRSTAPASRKAKGAKYTLWIYTGSCSEMSATPNGKNGRASEWRPSGYLYDSGKQRIRPSWTWRSKRSKCATRIGATGWDLRRISAVRAAHVCAMKTRGRDAHAAPRMASR